MHKFHWSLKQYIHIDELPEHQLSTILHITSALKGKQNENNYVTIIMNQLLTTVSANRVTVKNKKENKKK